MARFDRQMTEIIKKLGDRLETLVKEIDSYQREQKSIQDEISDFEEFQGNAGDLLPDILRIARDLDVELSYPGEDEFESLKNRESELSSKIEELESERALRKTDAEKLHAKFPQIWRLADIARENDEAASSDQPDYFSRFNLAHFQDKIANHYEDSFALIVDGYNAIGTIPRYDYRGSGCRLGECRDRLCRDLDFLSSQISGKIIIVFDTVHTYYEKTVNDLKIVYPDNRQSSKQSGDDQIVKLVEELSQDSQAVFVVTNDNELGGRVTVVGANLLKIGDVFKY
ncbi:NYN domain-containing protein [bacterium]|nr:NYN domain-containing protein [bacterium]